MFYEFEYNINIINERKRNFIIRMLNFFSIILERLNPGKFNGIGTGQLYSSDWQIGQLQ
jgi:hypothetical protein